MSDATLLAIGCAVTFTALAGAYVFLEAMFKAESAGRAASATAVAPEPAAQVTAGADS